MHIKYVVLHILGFSGGVAVKNPPVLQEMQVQSQGRSPGEGNGNPLQYYCLRNHVDRGAWWATVHGSPRVRHDLLTKQQQLRIYPF